MLRWTAVLAAAVAGLFFAWFFLVPQVHHWNAERAIGRFEAGGSQAAAEKLIKRLRAGVITAPQGQRILKLLLRPQVTTRSAYRVGEPAWICAELPFRLRFPDGRIMLRCGLEGADTLVKAANQRAYDELLTTPQFFVAHRAPPRPGVYDTTIRHKCTLTYRRWHLSLGARVRAWISRRIVGRRRVRVSHVARGPTYACTFGVPVEITVAAPDEAEPLALLSEATLDEAMRGAVTCGTSDRHGVYETPSGRRGYRQLTVVAVNEPPVATAFQLHLGLNDGPDVARPRAGAPQRIRYRAHSSGAFVVDVGRFGLETPGQYTGVLRLTADPNYAYEDPAIKTIWNGTLEFPVSFFVYDKPRLRAR